MYFKNFKPYNSEEKVPVVQIKVVVSDDFCDYNKIEIISTIDSIKNNIIRCSEIKETEHYFENSKYYEFLSKLMIADSFAYETDICDPLIDYICCLDKFQRSIHDNPNGGYLIFIRLNRNYYDDYSIAIMMPELMEFFDYNLPGHEEFGHQGYKMTFGSKLELLNESQQELIVAIAKIIKEKSDTNQISLELLKTEIHSLEYSLNWEEDLDIINGNLELYSLDKENDTLKLYDWFWVLDYLDKNSMRLKNSA